MQGFGEATPMHRQGNHLHSGSPHRSHCHPTHGPGGTGYICVPGAPVRSTPEGERALSLAIRRAESALGAGRLISPSEAMALAGPEARTKETLFSIARDVAWETGVNQDELLAGLVARFPDLG